MTSFESELKRTTAMGLEYRDLLVRTSGIGHNHGPTEADFEPSVFVRLRELPDLLTAAFTQLDRGHRAAWRAYLDESTNRLRILAESGEGDHRMAAHVLERWKPWIAGEPTGDPPAWFGLAVELLTNNQRTIDQLASTTS